MTSEGTASPADDAPTHIAKGPPAAREPRPPGDQIMVTRVGLRIPDALTYDGWETAGGRLAAVVESSAWCLGDWVVYGQSRYSDRYRQAVDALGLDYQTIRNYAWVARRFDRSRRREGLSFQHHAEVAALAEEQQEYWLDQAESNGWSRNELRRQVRAGKSSGAEPGKGLSAIPPIKVSPERLARWRAAAELSQTTLLSWVVEQLDAASSWLPDPESRD